MNLLDWIIIGLYFSLSITIGLYFFRRAGGNIENYFLSGRKLPWWLAGLSMVATTFAADTPLAVAGLVGKNGIAGNWIWWNMLIGGMLTVFFFAKLWRRAGILTDIEFIEMRYSGKAASFLRGFKAIYLGIFMNCIIMGWVNLAMGKILLGMFPEYVNENNVIWFLGLAMLITAFYSALSGLWGIAVTDAFQFILAMTGCIVLAVIVVNSPQIGGISGLESKLPDWALKFTPEIAGSSVSETSGILMLSVSSFLAFVGIQWWASWYPGAEPGGGGYIAQRIMSAKDEKNSLLATLFFQVAHYCIRPWPWIIVGLCALVLYPGLSADEKELGFVKAMNDFLPPGLKGLLLAAFFGAYMSTISTHLNWGTSYFVNDFYRRFISTGETEKSYVLVSRIMTIVFMFISVAITGIMTTISGVWAFVLECGAGLGLVLILRWYWWRINAISEIVATFTPFIVYGFLYFGKFEIKFPDTLFVIVPVTTISWLAATFLTKPVDEIKLTEFYRKVHPGGWGWKKFSEKITDVTADKGYIILLADWICGIIMVYSFLFGIGKLIFGQYLSALIYVLIALLAGWIILKHTKYLGWNVK
ncbi:MAG: Na+:solute symporter [Ignavibacteria bacterium]|nr:Na+:solute symporter [Ignavibacteria bacterium]